MKEKISVLKLEPLQKGTKTFSNNLRLTEHCYKATACQPPTLHSNNLWTKNRNATKHQPTIIKPDKYIIHKKRTTWHKLWHIPAGSNHLQPFQAISNKSQQLCHNFIMFILFIMFIMFIIFSRFTILIMFILFLLIQIKIYPQINITTKFDALSLKN